MRVSSGSTKNSYSILVLDNTDMPTPMNLGVKELRMIMHTPSFAQSTTTETASVW
jgi:hypothetical protein